MGAAEDAYRRRQEAADAGYVEKARTEELVAEMHRLLPIAAANLKRLKYPDDMSRSLSRSSVTVTSSMIPWRGEERIVWVLDYATPIDDSDEWKKGLYMLSDGTLIVHEVENCAPVLTLHPFDMPISQEAMERLRMIANYRRLWTRRA